LSAAKKNTGLVARAVSEALGTLVSPSLCEQLIARSLAAYGLDEVPEHGREIASWLEHALRPVVEHAVGPDAADLMMSQLAPMAAQAARQPAPFGSRADPRASTHGAGSRSDREPTQPISTLAAARATLPPASSFDHAPSTGVFTGTERVTLAGEPANANELLREAQRSLPPAPGVEPPPPRVPTQPQSLGRAPDPAAELPRVLAASRDPDKLEALRRYLAGTADVIHVPDLATLLEAFDAAEAAPPLVLLDCFSPSLHVGSVTAIREDLPLGTTVVVWGADHDTWRALERDAPAGRRWVRCSQEATTDDVGSLCSMLLG
jgi:hypothetical protein